MRPADRSASRQSLPLAAPKGLVKMSKYCWLSGWRNRADVKMRLTVVQERRNRRQMLRSDETDAAMHLPRSVICIIAKPSTG